MSHKLGACVSKFLNHLFNDCSFWPILGLFSPTEYHEIPTFPWYSRSRRTSGECTFVELDKDLAVGSQIVIWDISGQDLKIDQL